MARTTRTGERYFAPTVGWHGPVRGPCSPCPWSPCRPRRIPARIGCYIWDQNHSFELIRRSKECVINIPTVDLIDQAVGIGNCSGREVDKFEKFKLTPVLGEKVAAPLIRECYANFECRLFEGRLVAKWGLFIWEVVKAHAATSPKYPETFHYRGDGIFMLSGRSISLRRKFKAEML